MTARACPFKDPVQSRTAPSPTSACRCLPQPACPVSRRGGAGAGRSERQAAQPMETRSALAPANGSASTPECSRRGGEEAWPAPAPPPARRAARPAPAACPSAERSGGHGGEGAEPQGGGGPRPGRAGRQHQRGPRPPGCAEDQPGPQGHHEDVRGPRRLPARGGGGGG